MKTRSIRLSVAAPPSDVFEKMRGLVVTPDFPGRPKLQRKSLTVVSDIRFVGALKPPNFYIRPQRATGLASTFSTTLNATVVAQNEGSIIQGSFRELPFVRWFGRVFAAFLMLFGLAGILLPVFGIHPKQGSTVPIVVFAVILLIAEFLLFRVARHDAAKDEDTLLRQIGALFASSSNPLQGVQGNSSES